MVNQSRNNEEFLIGFVNNFFRQEDRKKSKEENAVELNDQMIIDSLSNSAQTQDVALLKNLDSKVFILVREIKNFKIANDWKSRVEVLNLSHMKIRKINSLEGMINLQQVNLSHNLIEKIEGFESCLNIGKRKGLL